MHNSITRIDTSTGTLPPLNHEREARVIKRAIRLLETRLFTTGPRMMSPEDVRNYLRLTLVQEPNEVFTVVFLNSSHEVIACEMLFKGTIDGTGVYPRVIVQRALVHNAAALILAHQHPSGDTTPSQQDRRTTSRIQTALALVDITVLDHFIIGKGEPFSFAEAGLL